MMQRTAYFFFALIFLLLIYNPVPVYAHAGGGPPFLKINGTFSQTNKLYAGGTNISVSQDDAPEKYLVNTPIEFEIDTTQLQVPKEILEQSQFRWTWEEGSTAYEYGTKISHTYTKPGSYLMLLDVKTNEDPRFLVINTVQLDIVENKTYQTPRAKISVVGNSYKSGKSISFKAQAVADPNASIKEYTWYFGNEEPRTGKDVTFTYKEPLFFDYIFLKVTDSNSFYAYDAVQVSGDEGNIAFYSLSQNEGNVPTVQKGVLSQITANPIRSGIILFVIVVASFAMLILRKSFTPKREQ